MEENKGFWTREIKTQLVEDEEPSPSIAGTASGENGRRKIIEY